MFRYFLDRFAYDAIRRSFRGLAKERAQTAEEAYRGIWEAALPDLARKRAAYDDDTYLAYFSQWFSRSVMPRMKRYGYGVANDLNHRVGEAYNQRVAELADDLRRNGP